MRYSIEPRDNSIIIEYYDNTIMNNQKITNVLDNKSNQPSKIRKKSGLKKMINQEESILPIVTLDLKL